MAGNMETLGRLQTTCADVFAAVTSNLQVGMSETDIAHQLDQEFKYQGIADHWYDVPFNVLIGTDRFVEGLTTSDYAIKNPSSQVRLGEGSPVYVDLSPIDPATRQWGDWSSTAVFQPRKGVDDEQIAFLQEMRDIHRQGIAQITSGTTGADVANYYLDAYKKLGVTLLDVRNNVGHSLHAVPKQEATRVWLDTDNQQPLGEGLFTVEPGGSRPKKAGIGIVIARFEVSIHIPESGSAVILGDRQLPPLTI
jgi:hypothetical protein